MHHLYQTVIILSARLQHHNAHTRENQKHDIYTFHVYNGAISKVLQHSKINKLFTSTLEKHCSRALVKKFCITKIYSLSVCLFTFARRKRREIFSLLFTLT